MPPAILGVHVGHDAAAAVLVDGRLVYAEEEERLTGVKAQGGCPWGAIDAGLAAAGAADAEVEAVALSWQLDRYRACRRQLAAHAEAVGNPGWAAKRARELAVVDEAVAGLRARFPGAALLDFPHHLSHLACAVGFLGTTSTPGPVLGLVADALGDAEPLSVYLGRDVRALLTEPERVHALAPGDSLGFLYKRAAEALGFEGREACGHLMALAGWARGEAEPLNLRLLAAGPEGILPGRRASGDSAPPPEGLATAMTLPGWPGLDPHAFDPFRGHGATAARCFRDPLPARDQAAVAIQALTEELLASTLDALVEHHRPGTVFVTGGVSLNCAALGRLTRGRRVGALLAGPVKKDSGTAIGAALLAGLQRGQASLPTGWRRCLRLGAEVRGDESAWTSAPGTYRGDLDRDQLVAALADDLDAGHVVALADGRGEFGPRALGARSLLACPSRAEVATRLNAVHKQRQPFQPFAGAFLAEPFLARYPETHADLFMGVAVQLDAQHRAALPAITHRDGTTRAQLVGPADDGVLRALLEERQRRGRPPVVLNTSLNPRGRPIARAAADVLAACDRLQVDLAYTPCGRWSR